MKILRIIARLNIGGPARNAVLLTEGFSTLSQRTIGGSLEQYSLSDRRESRAKPRGEVEKIKYETVLVCGEVAESEGDMMYLAAEKGIKPIIVKELGRELSWKDDWAAFWKIYKIICMEKPDIIHTHTAKAGTLGRMAGILYRLLRRGVYTERPKEVLSEANVRSECASRNDSSACRNDAPTCHCEAAGRSNLVLIHTFHGHVFSGYFGKIKTVFFMWVERFLALFTDKIITVSENLKKELVEKYRIAQEKKFSVVELGFELDELFKLPPRQNSEIINIGIVGRLVPIKNHKMMLRVAQGQSQKALAFSQKVNFIIVGDGEMREELERYAEELGIKDIVEFKGWVEDLKTIYEGLDIVILTSLNEGTPVSLIEAMASAKPVVATKVGGVADIVQDGESGYLVESSDEEDFSQKLLDLIKDPEKRRKFGEYGRSIVKERFSKERLIKDIKKLYNTILSK